MGILLTAGRLGTAQIYFLPDSHIHCRTVMRIAEEPQIQRRSTPLALVWVMRPRASRLKYWPRRHPFELSEPWSPPSVESHMVVVSLFECAAVAGF